MGPLIFCFLGDPHTKIQTNTFTSTSMRMYVNLNGNACVASMHEYIKDSLIFNMYIYIHTDMDDATMLLSIVRS